LAGGESRASRQEGTRSRIFFAAEPPHADDLLHHSDRGSQYTSGNYQTLLAQAQIAPSMSGTGSCYDNAMMESFFATLKTEYADHRFATRAEARRAIFEFIEVWYNRQRRHSALNYLTPAEFEVLPC
jgi:putative transposase